MHHLLGIAPTEATLGAATCSMPLSGWLATPFGWPQGGFIVLLADLALALATQTTLAKGEGMASVDIKVNFLRPVAGDGSVLEARAKVVHRGRSLTVGTAEILGADGRPVALATGSAALLGTLTSGDLAFAAGDARPRSVRGLQADTEVACDLPAVGAAPSAGEIPTATCAVRAAGVARDHIVEPSSALGVERRMR